MRSTITTRGQTVIPIEIRKRFALGPADGLEWIVEERNSRGAIAARPGCGDSVGRAGGNPPSGCWMTGIGIDGGNERVGLDTGYVCAVDLA